MKRSPAPWRRILAGVLTVAVILEFTTFSLGLNSSPAGSASGANTPTLEDTLLDQDVLTRLKTVVASNGVSAALDTLAGLSSTSAAIGSSSHGYAHAVGAYSYSLTKDVPATYQACDTRFNLGCSHGVVTAALAAGGKGVSLTRFCEEVVRATFIGGENSCWHALGHAIAHTSSFNNVDPVLTKCDGLDDVSKQKSCWDGVLMEYTLTAISEQENHLPRQGLLSNYLKAEDPLFPCPTLSASHQQACYQQIHTQLSYLARGDWTLAGTFCTKAPLQAARHDCYGGLGLIIGGVTAAEAQAAETNCLKLPAEGRETCSVHTLGSQFIDAPAAAARCSRVVNGEEHTACFRFVGYKVGLSVPDAASRTRICQELAKGEDGRTCTSVAIGIP